MRGDRLDGGERVLDPVVELVQQKHSMVFDPLAFADIETGGHGADDGAGRIANRRGLGEKRQRRTIGKSHFNFVVDDDLATGSPLDRQHIGVDFLAIAESAIVRRRFVVGQRRRVAALRYSQ